MIEETLHDFKKIVKFQIAGFLRYLNQTVPRILGVI